MECAAHVLTLALGALAVAIVPAQHVWPRAAAGGLLVGLASLGRPTALVALPVVLLALRESRPGVVGSPGVPAARPNERPAKGAAVRRDPGVLGLAVTIAAGCLLALLPVVVRNARLGGGLVITTNGGVNFYAGNNPAANGRFHDAGRDAVLKEIVNGAEPFEEGGRSPLQARCMQLARMGCDVFHLRAGLLERQSLQSHGEAVRLLHGAVRSGIAPALISKTQIRRLWTCRRRST